MMLLYISKKRNIACFVDDAGILSKINIKCLFIEINTSLGLIIDVLKHTFTSHVESLCNE